MVIYTYTYDVCNCVINNFHIVCEMGYLGDKFDELKVVVVVVEEEELRICLVTRFLALFMVMKQRYTCSSNSSSCSMKLWLFLLSWEATSSLHPLCTHTRINPPTRSSSLLSRATSRLTVSRSLISMYVPFAAASTCADHLPSCSIETSSSDPTTIPGAATTITKA